MTTFSIANAAAFAYENCKHENVEYGGIEIIKPGQWAQMFGSCMDCGAEVEAGATPDGADDDGRLEWGRCEDWVKA